jgi:hypothetical protein
MDGGLCREPERVVEVAGFRTGAGYRQARILAGELCELARTGAFSRPG